MMFQSHFPEDFFQCDGGKRERDEIRSREEGELDLGRVMSSMSTPRQNESDLSSKNTENRSNIDNPFHSPRELHPPTPSTKGTPIYIYKYIYIYIYRMLFGQQKEL